MSKTTDDGTKSDAPYAHYRAALLGARIALTPVLQPARPPASRAPSEPVPWRVWPRDVEPADATMFEAREAIDAAWAWASPHATPLAAVVFVDRADVDPIESQAQEFEVSVGVAGNRLVRHIGPLWPRESVR